MSGGVDSSVAAHLLLAAGHDVIGVFMRHGEKSPVACDLPSSTPSPENAVGLPVVDRPEHKQGCCSASDAEDARRVADRLAIPFFALNLEEEFGRIIDYFVDEYTAGRTPNPCVVCNQWIKFGKLFDYAHSVGADFVATGHYARLASCETSVPKLCRGRDHGQDKSYALFGVRREHLSRMMLPVGGFEKPRIREIAASLGLNVAQKRDSQEICFVTSGRHEEFVRSKTGVPSGSRLGEFVTTDGTVVGEHHGIERFTVGQRKGLGIALGEPRFVVRIEPEAHRVVLGTKEELARDELAARRTNWLIDIDRRSGVEGQALRCRAQIRYNSRSQPARATIEPNDRLQVVFDEPVYGVAPGQAVVLYDESDQQVLGGGWIE